MCDQSLPRPLTDLELAINHDPHVLTLIYTYPSSMMVYQFDMMGHRCSIIVRDFLKTA